MYAIGAIEGLNKLRLQKLHTQNDGRGPAISPAE
jgi:hypothetical protein